MEAFKDNFSQLSELYAKYRPSAPADLFAWLRTISPAHDLALDCGTGNGQAAVQLAEHFRKVVATDPSAEQIRHAVRHERVEYRVERAENPVLGESTADIVTVSQALHWFDHDAFFTEVKRALKPGGVLAVWAYPLPEIAPGIDDAIRYFHEEVVGPFWQYENRMIDKAYANISFPFPLIEAPEFRICREFSLEELTGLLYTWSAVLKYSEHNGCDPVEAFLPELGALWGDAERRSVTWTLILKAGINEK